MKKVLMLNTSLNEIRMMKALREMGYYIIATGGLSRQPGEKYADEYIQMDYSDKDSILQLAQELNIDAICACCNDFGVITAAYVAEKMGLPGHDTYENALIMHHKDKFKQFAEKYGINTPIAKYFTDENDAIRWLNEAVFPIIVKPTDLTGGKGVSRANDKKEAICSVRRAFNKSRIKHIVIEPFIEGSQHACCTFIINEKVVAICTNNEYSFANPYKVEIDTYPAEKFDSVKDELVKQAEKMASTLHLNDGILSMQYIMNNGTPHIIEAMRRVLGNLYMIPAEKLTGLNWDYWEAKVYCGLGTCDFPNNLKQDGYYAYRTIMGTKNGFVKRLVIPEDFNQYIFDKYIIWDAQIPINDYMSEALAFIFFKFNSMEEMNDILLKQYSRIYAEY